MKNIITIGALILGLTSFGSLSNGLVAHYKFDGNANDSSGNDNNGVVLGATLTVDRFGNKNNAYAFNGDYGIRVDNSPSLNSVKNDNMSVAFWAKFDALDNRYAVIVDKRDGKNKKDHFGWHFIARGGLNSSTGLVMSGLLGTDDDISSSEPLDEVWNHWAVSVSNGHAVLYKNGCVVGEKTYSTQLDSVDAAMFIGCTFDNGNSLYGSLDDVRIYNRGLSAAEVQMLYNDDGLVAWYKFDGDAKDSSGNENDGVVRGAILTADRFGNSNSAYSFNGNYGISVDSSPSLNSVKNDSMSVAFWAKFDALDNRYAVIVDKRDGKNKKDHFGWHFIARGGLNSSTGLVMSGLLGTDDDISSSEPLDEVWNHWAVSVSNGHAVLYKNGSVVGEKTYSTQLSSVDAAMFIGCTFDNGNSLYGSLDDVRIYNRALSTTEVNAIYNEGGKPISYHTVLFNANGGMCARTSAVVENGSTVGTLPTATCDGYTFLGWFTAAVGGEQVSSETVVTADVTWYAHWQEQVVEPTIYAIQFNANGGSCARTSAEVEDSKAVGALPTATREGYDFLGWFTAANGGTQVTGSTVVTADAIWYAHWQEQVVEPDEPDVPPVDPGDDDEPMDASIANTYDGVIVDADGLPMGYINVKTAKATGKGDTKVSKVTATIQMVGEAKKVTVKANVAVSDAAFTTAASDGRVLDLTFSRNGIWGAFDGYEIDGVRNLLTSTAKSDKGTDAKIAADAVYAALKGNYVIAYQDDNGWNGLSVTVMTKGKVRVSGKLANGTSVATTSQLIVGSDYSVIPIIYTKKDTSLAFNIYFSNDGAETEVFGYYDAVISSVGGLASGLSFYLGDEVYNLFGESYSLCDQFLPDGLSVEPVSASKWSVANGAKAGSIKLKDSEVIDTKESDNPSGLKLTFNSRAGTFSGSFKVYALDSKDKLKTFTATVSGVVIDGIGYGTATIKKIGSCAVMIAE